MKTKLIRLFVALALLAAPLASPAANLVVTNLADSGPGTLRSAITNAAGGAVITFAPNLSGATITLSNTLTINTNLTIDASALPGGLQINGNGAVTVFNVASTNTVFLNSLTITNGFASGDSGYGGGICDDFGASLTLTNCTLSGNAGNYRGGGGAIEIIGGTLMVNNSTFSGNWADDLGGAIDAENGTTLTVNDSTFSGNQTDNLGGGLFVYESTLTINNSTFSGNQADNDAGGGICCLGTNTLTINGSTFSANSAGEGGGIAFRFGTLTITNSIIAGNIASSVADIYNFGTLTYGGSNLVQSVVNAGTITGPAPLTNAPDLAPLGNYGGPTQTMPPLPGSPAIDAGSNDATNNFATDQRGLPRLVGPQVDIGAVEFQASPVVTNADSGPGSLRYAIANATNNATITFDPSLSGATITLSNTLTINTNLTIDASVLTGGLQINGNGAVTVFNVASAITVFLNSLTITNGFAAGSGGGIFNSGTLTLNQCTLSGNSAPLGGGGGIYSLGMLLTLNQCTLSGNYVTYDGGGISISIGTLALNQCTLSGNSAYDGGGIWCRGLLRLNQCTLSGNSADIGGGGGIYMSSYGAGRLAMTNTIVAGNRGSPGADIYANGGNTFPAPNLAPLGNYGGPTQTMPPLPGSPAIGAGSVAANSFATDQRGYSRTQNGLIDLGAVELQSPAANPPVLENITVPAGGGANGLQFTFTNAPAADFTVLTATNVSLALTNWTVLGEVQQVAPGQYQFTDPQAATNLARFYRVRSP